MFPKVDKERTIFIIPKFEHELVACLSVLGKPKAFLLRAGREAVIGERGSHYMECWGLFPAIGKEGKDLGNFDKAARPWIRSAGGFLGSTTVTHSRGRRAEELLPLHRSSDTRNVYPRIQSRRLVLRS